VIDTIERLLENGVRPQVRAQADAMPGIAREVAWLADKTLQPLELSSEDPCALGDEQDHRLLGGPRGTRAWLPTERCSRRGMRRSLKMVRGEWASFLRYVASDSCDFFSRLSSRTALAVDAERICSSKD